jgi:hypothetical protein
LKFSICGLAKQKFIYYKDGFVRERAAMNNVKTRLCNKIEDEFLTDSLMVYIESEVAATISINSIIDDFWDSKK